MSEQNAPTVPSPVDAAALLETARRWGRAGTFRRQLAAARRAVANATDPAVLGDALVEEVEALAFLQRSDEAVVSFDRLLALDAPDPAGVGRAGCLLGMLFARAGDPERARPYVEAAERAPADAPIFVRGGAVIARAMLEAASDRPVQALTAFEDGMRGIASDEPLVRGMTVLSLGRLWHDLGVYGRAIEALHRALSFADALGPAVTGSVHIDLSHALRGAGEPTAAAHHARIAIDLHRAGDRVYRLGHARLALARALADQGQVDTARMEADAAREAFQRSESEPAAHQARLLLGELAALDDALDDAFRWVLPVARGGHPPGPAARVLLAELSLQRPALAEWLDALEGELTADLRVRVERVRVERALVSGDPDALRDGIERLSDACATRAARDARRRSRIFEVQEQVEAVWRERERAEELAAALGEQERLREAAETAEAERRDLLELVAHDLRNPLSALVLLLDELDEVEDPEELRALLVMGKQSAGAMRAVLDDALRTSGALGGKGSTVPVDLVATATDCVHTFAAGALAKGQALELVAPGPVVVRGTPSLLRSVVDNFVSNALKFTPRGGRVRVEITVGARARIAVHDDGPGLAPGEATVLFDRGRRGLARPTAGEPSSGLGLYLVRKVAEGHGGAVGAHSEGPGRGSVFWMELPIDPDRGP